MSVLGAVSYELNADSRPLATASREAVKAFESIDEAARKANTSILGVEKSHSILGKTIRGAVIGGAVTGMGLFAKHLLEGTKAGESLNGVLGKLGGHLRSFRDTMAEGLRPLRAWLTNTEAGTKAVTTFEKGISKTREGFQKLDQVTSQGAKSVKSWVEEKKKATGTEISFSKVMEEGRGVIAKSGAGISELGKRFQAWNQAAAQGTGASAKFAQGLSSLGRGTATFGKGVKEVGSFVDELGEGMTRAELGALGLTGKLGKAAVIATHFSEVLGLGGMALSVFGGNLGLVGGVIATAASGVTGLTALLGGLVEAAGFAAEALGERLLASVEVWIERFAEAEVTILGFNRAIQAYNTTVKDTPIVTEDLEKSMSAVGKATGTATVDIRQATLRALELSKVTGLTSEQVNQLVERSIDLSSALHRDLWDAVWAVLDAMRGFPLMATGFGLALDEETLKTSEFTKALGGTYESLNELQKSQVIFQEMMKQSSFAAGIAAEQLDTTLVGAARKSEQAFNSFHMELGKGAATVWQPYSSALAQAIGTLNLIPRPIIHAVGAFTAFSGVALKVIGRLLELAGAMITFNVAIFALTKGIPLLGTGLAWLLTKVTGAKVAFEGWGQILKVLAGATLVGFGNVVKGTAQNLLALVFAAGQLTIFGKLALITAGLGLAIFGLVKAYKALNPSMKEAAENAKKDIKQTEDRIHALKSLKEEVEKGNKSDKEYRDLISQLAKNHPQFLELLRKEKVLRKDIIDAIDGTVEAEKRRKGEKEGIALAEVTRQIQEQKKAWALLQAERRVILEEMKQRSKFKVEQEMVGAWSAATDAVFGHSQALQQASKELARIDTEGEKAQKEIARLEGELGRVVVVRKEEQKVIATTAEFVKKLHDANRQELDDIREAGSVYQEAKGIIDEVFQRRFSLIDEARERERESAEASRDTQQTIFNQIYERETVALRQRREAHEAYNASLLSQATKSTADTIDAFLDSSGEYFSALEKFEKDNLDVHLRSLEVFKEGATTFSDAYRETAAAVFTDMEDKARVFYKEFQETGTRAFSNVADSARRGFKEIELGQTGLSSSSSKSILIMSKDFAGFSETIQEAYSKISQRQGNYLKLLMNAGPVTQDIAATTVRALREVDKGFDAQIAGVRNLIEEYKRYEKEQQAIDQLDLKIMNLRRQRLEAFAKIFARAYEDMAARQRSLMSQQEADLQKLRGMEEERLRFSSDAEKILRDLQIQSGELVMTERARWQKEMQDLDARFTATRKLSAEERAKIDKELIASYLGLNREILDTQGNIVISEQQAARAVKEKILPLIQDVQKSSRQAEAEIAENMRTRQQDIAELGQMMEVAKAGMVGLQEEHRKLSKAISDAEYKITVDMEDKVSERLKDMKLLLDSVAAPRKIDLRVDWKSLAAIGDMLEKIEKSFSRIQQLKDIAAGTVSKPPPPPAATTPSPSPAEPKPVLGAPGEISTRGFQRGGQVTGRVPGFGGGDRVRIQALPGQFVVRKEAVSRVGAGMLAALSQVPDGRLGGFQPQRSVPIAVEPGEFVFSKEAVAARGIGFFNRINRMQEGGAVSRFPRSEASASRWQAIGQAFGTALNPPMDDQTRVESALELAKLYSGLSAVGQANRLRQIEEFERRFQASGHFLTQEEHDRLAEGLTAEMTSLQQLQRSGYLMRTDPTGYLEAQRILKKWVSAGPGGISAGVEAPEEESTPQDRFQRGRRPSRLDTFGAVDRGDLTAQGILEDPGLSPRFAARLLRRAGFGVGEILNLRKQRQIEMTTQALEEGRLSPARALGQLMGIGRTKSGIGGLTSASALSLLLERELLPSSTLSAWVREGRVVKSDTLFAMLRSGIMSPEVFANTLLAAGKSREDVSRMLRNSRRPIDEGLFTLLRSDIPLSQITSALEGKGDLGSLVATAQMLEFAPTTNYDYQGRRRGPRQTIDLKFLEKARSALGLQTGGIVPSMEGFDAAPPLAFSRSSGSQRGVTGFSSSDMKRSASDIEGAFSEMFSNLERRAGMSASRIGQTLFESLYSTLKDRLIRESKMG